jgi:hypothetical protein
LVKARYGYTDDQVLSIPFARLKSEIDILIKAIYREDKRAWEKIARICFTHEGKEKETFADYKARVGFEVSRCMATAKEMEFDKQKALEEAAAIVAMVQGMNA